VQISESGLTSFSLIPKIPIIHNVVTDSAAHSGIVKSDLVCRPTGSLNSTVKGEDTWPSPVITSVYPDSIFVGSKSLLLTIDGNYFIPETRVLWDARDYTKKYQSPYQITAEILDVEIQTPGQHYIQVYNPSPCGGPSNILAYQVRDNGQSFPLTTNPRTMQVLKGEIKSASILVQNLPKGLIRFNLTLTKDSAAPFQFFFSGFPSWVTNPLVTWPDNDQLLIVGEDVSDRIGNKTEGVLLFNISVIGSAFGTGYIHCTLNEGVASDSSRYGSSYTALPVIVGEIIPYPNSAGGEYSLPGDPDGDGLYEDINGNGWFDLHDVVTFFQSSDHVINHEPVWAFDFDRNGVINLNDVIYLFQNSMEKK